MHIIIYNLMTVVWKDFHSCSVVHLGGISLTVNNKTVFNEQIIFIFLSKKFKAEM